MIEEVQDKIVDLFEAGLAANLAALASPVGGEAITLTAPNKYVINYDPSTCILPQNMMPACLMLPEGSTQQHRLGGGLTTYWEHVIRIVFLLEQVSTRADALTACETLQRQRSRYAEAAIKTLWAGQQTAPLYQVKLDAIKYSKTLGNDEQTRFLGSVWLFVTVLEKETL